MNRKKPKLYFLSSFFMKQSKQDINELNEPYSFVIEPDNPPAPIPCDKSVTWCSNFSRHLISRVQHDRPPRGQNPCVYKETQYLFKTNITCTSLCDLSCNLHYAPCCDFTRKSCFKTFNHSAQRIVLIKMFTFVQLFPIYTTAQVF